MLCQRLKAHIIIILIQNLVKYIILCVALALSYFLFYGAFHRQAQNRVLTFALEIFKVFVYKS